MTINVNMYSHNVGKIAMLDFYTICVTALTLIIKVSSFIYVTNDTHIIIWFGFMVFNVTFNNISVISWKSVLLVEQTGVPAEIPLT